MNESDFGKFSEILSRAALVTALQRGKDWNELIVVLFQELSVYDIESVRSAVLSHIRAEKFFPTLADIVRGIEGKRQKNCEQLVILGWSLVWDAIRRFGHTITLRFPHPAFHFAIERLGGWAQLCATATVENEPFKRRDFEKVFNFGLEVASWNGEDGKIRVSAYLMGLNDASNRQRGYLHGRPQVLDAVTGDILSSEVLALPDSEGRSKATDISALIGNLAVSKSVFGGGLR